MSGERITFHTRHSQIPSTSLTGDSYSPVLFGLFI
jgi:hypothetical protein